MQTYGNHKYVFVETPTDSYTFNHDGQSVDGKKPPERVKTQVRAYIEYEL